MATLSDRLDHVLGVKAADRLTEAFDMTTVEDLLRHYPVRYATQGQPLTEEEPEEGAHITVIGRITKTELRPMKNRRGSLLKVQLDTGAQRPLEATFFNGDKVRYLVKDGVRAMMSGTVHWWRPDRWNLSHPDYLILPDKAEAGVEELTSVRGSGALRLKSDPYARAFERRPATACCVTPDSAHAWQDSGWMQARARSGQTGDWQTAPMSTYEMHLGSWMRHPDRSFYSYRDLAARLVPYLVDLGYTHVEFLPLMEHPLDESWGYQCTGFFAPSSRFGSADDLRFLIDSLHQAGIGVILDWVPGHFPADDWALAHFDGTALYEHEDPKQKMHPDWGTHVFNYGRNEVRSFLLSSAYFWLSEFHVDALRVDAVASMIYLDYSRKAGEWTPNVHGGRENLEAIAFLRELNEMVHGEFAGALTIAEESTAWPMVSRPTWLGGLGFSMKWNMGWMNDTLDYMQHDPVYRRYQHERLTFGQLYAYTENFVLPLSHDEVVHGKSSLLGKMPGDEWQRFANLRLLLAYQMMAPGKKLQFMGAELGQSWEWRAGEEMPWHLLQYPLHAGVRSLMRELNHLYVSEPALHELDFSSAGFQWIDCHDADQSVVSWLRRSRDGRHAVVVLNFTPVPRHDYRLGVPQAQDYLERINTDSTHYGGSDLGNGGRVSATPQAWMGFPASLVLSLPPLAALVLLPA
jgi:1,4-alpha-glucan branching enzyme